MRFVVYEWIWHDFDVLHRHLLLMMVFDCPQAFRHKKREYILSAFCFCFQGESQSFCWLKLVELFRIVSRSFTLYFTFLALVIFALFCWDIHVRGSIFFVLYVSCFNCLLAYVYEFFIDICLYCMLFEIKILFYLLVFFHTCGYAFCLSVSGNIQVDSIKLLSSLATDGQQLRLNLCL